jgi:hypothetical protein
LLRDPVIFFFNFTTQVLFLVCRLAAVDKNADNHQKDDGTNLKPLIAHNLICVWLVLFKTP